MKLSKRLEDAFFLAVVAAFCGGAVPVAAKVALEVFHPFTVITLRFFFATLFLLPFVYKKKELNKKLLSKLWWVGLIGSLNPILLFIALPFTKASVSPLIYACVPAITALYFYLANNQRITQKQVMGIVIGLIGVALIILLPTLQKQQNISAFYGNILIFIAAFNFMFYGIISKRKQAILGASPIALTFYFCLVTFLVSLPFTGYELQTYQLGVVGFRHIFSAVFVGLVGTGIFYLSYQYALRMSSELTASLFTYLQPIATILLAVAFLNEKISLPFIIGGVFAVFGARIAARKS